MSVSAEVLDCSLGRAAEGVPVTLLREVGACWEEQASGITDECGLVRAPDGTPARGRYRISVDLDKYFPTLGMEPLQSRVEVTFRVLDACEDVHFLVSITPSSSTAYRVARRKNGTV